MRDRMRTLPYGRGRFRGAVTVTEAQARLLLQCPIPVDGLTLREARSLRPLARQGLVESDGGWWLPTGAGEAWLSAHHPLD